MNRILAPILTGIVLLTLQATLLAFYPIQKVRPDIVLILVLYLGFSYPAIPGGILAFGLGCLVDLFSGNSLGLYAFTRPLIFFVARLFRSHFYWEGISFQFVSVFIFALLEGWIILLLVAGLHQGPFHRPSTAMIHFLPQAVLTSLIAPVLFSLFNWGSVWLSKKQERHRR